MSGAHPVVNWWRRLWPISSEQRLENMLTPYQREVAFLVQSTSKAGTSPPWATELMKLLEQAAEAVRQHNPDRAWRYFHAAQRLELHGLRELGSDAFRARAGSLRVEALQKLRSWRRKRVEELFNSLPPKKGSAQTVSPAEFAAANEAAVILHEHFGNEALKQRAAQSQTRVLVGIALAAVVIWLGAAGPSVFVAPGAANGSLRWDNLPLLASVLLFGLMGAAFSALTSLSGQSAAQTIPEQVFTYRITLARQAVGVLSALAIYVLLAAGFVQVGNLPPTPPLILLAAFAAGFSERLVARALERFAGKVEGSKDDGAKPK